MCQFHPIHVFNHCRHKITILDDYLVHSCWGLHLDYRFLQIEGSWAPLSFVLWIVVKFLCSCLCLLDAIVQIHAIDKKNDQRLSYWKMKENIKCNKFFFDSRLLCCVCSGGYITLHRKFNIKHMSPFYSLSLIRIHLFFFTTSRIQRVSFQSNPRTSFRFPMESIPHGVEKQTLDPHKVNMKDQRVTNTMNIIKTWIR